MWLALALVGGMASMAIGQIDARRYGAIGDGVTDDTAAIQAALDAAATEGPVCLLPAGMYRVDGSLEVPPGVTFKGATDGVSHSEQTVGTVLLAYGGRGEEDGTPLVTLRPNAVIREMIIHYPEQTLPDVVPYPWTIRVDGELCQIENMTLTNPYRALDLGTNWNELHTVRNVFGCPLKVGVYIDQCTDIGRIENVHFNPNFWTRMALPPGFPGGDIKAYLEQNLVGFMIGKTDWEFISNSFVIFPRVGFLFDDFGHGPGNAIVTQSGSDIGPVAVRVERTQSHSGVQFVNGQFMSTLEVGPENQGPVKLTNCGFWIIPETGVQVDKQGPSTLVLNACHFSDWGISDPEAPCIRASGGRLAVHACEFMAAKPTIHLQEGLTAATIVGNLFRATDAIVDESGAAVESGLNASGE
jgi:hypothetical protein